MDIPLTIEVARLAIAAYLKEMMESSDSPLPVDVARDTMDLVLALLHAVLENCVFSYDAGDGKGPHLFKQVRGATMGSACVPPLANLYMAYLARPVVDRWSKGVDGGRLITGKGFIDDIFGLLIGTQEHVNRFKTDFESQEGNLRLTVVASVDHVDFLDVTVYRAADPTRLAVKPYEKVLNKHLFIPPWSGHSPHSLTSFISGEVKRLVRNSSLEEHAVDACLMLLLQLLTRGYSVETVLREMSRVRYSDRTSLLSLSKAVTPQSVVALSVTYTPVNDILPLGKCIRAVQEQLDRIRNNVRTTLGWRNDRNLQDLLHLQWPQG
jgi:hypothetical protein